jgi:hypothetical protein
VLHLALFIVSVNLEIDTAFIKDEEMQQKAQLAFKSLKASHITMPILLLITWVLKANEMHALAVIIQFISVICNYLPQLLAQWVVRMVLEELEADSYDWKWSNSGVWFLMEE